MVDRHVYVNVKFDFVWKMKDEEKCLRRLEESRKTVSVWLVEWKVLTAQRIVLCTSFTYFTTV